ncbi:MAG TPA: response regulator [Myxococcota bacterium]|nr:response regulator [Myxococcota bacterium]HRY91865.1 response regulator [Myxococcota bacterium]HSA23067.1 response regulator [Myxococcota bacterium]
MARKVLLVDDSVAIARQLTKLLTDLGDYEVVAHAKNGAEAVKLFKTVAPDVVLMDIVMPMMDGIQSLRTLLRLDPAARVVMVSSLGGVGAKVEEAIRLGARAVISKPFESDRIRAVLDGLFAQE